MNPIFSRRQFVRTCAGTAAFFTTAGLFAEQLALTPAQTEGPFYPDKLPLDTDNDLLILNDNITPAVGQITHLSGRILDKSGDPLRNAVVEIWQVDNNASYLHSKSGNRERYDGNFQGFGRFMTGRTGEYYFRTIKPVKYPGRTPHIHFAVKVKGKRQLTTQCYIKGEKTNDTDGVLRSSVKTQEERDRLMVDFQPLAGSKIGELTANWDIVLGITPES